MNTSTDKSFPYFVENEKFFSKNEIIEAREILLSAKKRGIPAAQDDIDKLTLKTQNSFFSGEDKIDLLKENVFSLEVKVFSYIVNGEEFQSVNKLLLASDITNIAREKLGLQDANWVLESLPEDNKFSSDEWVDLSKFKQFILIPGAPTPVAFV